MGQLFLLFEGICKLFQLRDETEVGHRKGPARLNVIKRSGNGETVGSDEICGNYCAAARYALEAVDDDTGIWGGFEGFDDPSDSYFEVGEDFFERHIEDR